MPTKIPHRLPGRPLWKYDDLGWKVYISAHDRFHQLMLRAFKQEIRKAHPDVRHQVWASGRTRKILEARRKFLEGEQLWYAQFNLEPPGMVFRSLPRKEKGDRRLVRLVTN